MLSSFKILPFIRDWLPIHLRKPIIFSLLKVLAYPLAYLYNEFLNYFTEKRVELNLNTQTIVLEAYLNSFPEWAVEGKKIQIENVAPRPLLTSFLVREVLPKPFSRSFNDMVEYDNQEDLNIIGYDYSGLAYSIRLAEMVTIDGNYLVKLPEELPNFEVNIVKITAILNRYKTAGKIFVIRENAV